MHGMRGLREVGWILGRIHRWILRRILNVIGYVSLLVHAWLGSILRHTRAWIEHYRSWGTCLLEPLVCSSAVTLIWKVWKSCAQGVHGESIWSSWLTIWLRRARNMASCLVDVLVNRSGRSSRAVSGSLLAVWIVAMRPNPRIFVAHEAFVDGR